MVSRNRMLVPEAEQAMDRFKGEVMSKEGYIINPANPDEVKYEVANELGIPLEKGYNGELKSKNAGRVGGKIGGKMVQEMIRSVEQQFLT